MTTTTHDGASSQAPAGAHTGYGYGMSQPATLLSFNLQLPAQVDFPLLDSWLQLTFDLTVPPVSIIGSAIVAASAFPAADAAPTTAAPLDDSAEHPLVEGLAWRMLLLGGALLQAVKIPVFDPGRIVSIKASPSAEGVFTVTVATPCIENIARQVFRQTYQIAANSLLTLCREQAPARPGHPLAEELNTSLVIPLERQMPGGTSTVPLLAAAHAMNIPFRHIGGGAYLLGWGCHARLVDRSSVEDDSVIGAKLSNNKFLSANFTRAAGLPTPRHTLVFSDQEARNAAHTYGWPVVVKPADRDRGEGVTVDIRDDQALLAALRTAASLSRAVLVEEQVDGVCHRLYVSHGKLRFAVKRRPKSVIGDGVHSVAQLIDQANGAEMAKPPWKRLKPFATDAMALASLAAAGLTLDSVPATGEYAPLRQIQSTDWGGVVENVTDTIHPDNAALAVRVAELFQLTSAGIDCISTDIRQPWHSNGAIINEVNYSPLFNDGSVAGQHRASFIADLISGDGRIPVDVFVGGAAARAQALAHQQALTQRGTACFVTSHNDTLDPQGSAVVLTTSSLLERATALLINRAVAHLVLIIQTDEALHCGLPVDRITTLTMVDDQLVSWLDSDTALPVTAAAGLQPLLERYSLGDDISVGEGYSLGDPAG